MKKNLLQTISVLELLLLIIVGNLSDKIANTLEINQTFLWVATLIVVTALAIITIYKNNFHLVDFVIIDDNIFRNSFVS